MLKSILILLMILQLLSLGNAFAEGRFSFAVVGDMPTIPDEDHLNNFNRLISLINKQNPAFSLHVGDLFDDKYCMEAHFVRTKALFDNFSNGIVYIPGDNEWIDCLAPDYNPSLFQKLFIRIVQLFDAGGVFNGELLPIEAYEQTASLSTIRRIFYSKNYIEGSNIKLKRADAPYIENSSWDYENWVFASVNQTGRINNYYRNYDEFYKRNTANQKWLNSVFQHASNTDADGVVLIAHTFGIDGMYRAAHLPIQYTPAYKDVLNVIIDNARQFNRNVLLVEHACGVSDGFYYGMSIKDGKEILRNVIRICAPDTGERDALLISINPNEHPPYSLQTISSFQDQER